MMHRTALPCASGLLAFLLASTPSYAQERPRLEEGPLELRSAPALPVVQSRDAEGRIVLHALRLTGTLQIDGRLDEEWYQVTPAITDFVQSVPNEGAPATERTEAWIAFDDNFIYVAGRIWDSAPESEWVANELRRDTNQLRQNDTFGIALDPYLDRRNAVMFYTNPLGAMADFQMTNEGNPNPDWNAIWEVRTGRFEGGWTVEMAIPFRSLRYRPGAEQVWGVQLRRVIRRKNEWAHTTLVPRAAAGTGSGAVFRISEYATLVGIEAPPPSRRLEVKPYGISGLQTARTPAGELDSDYHADYGLDVKYGITENLTLDLTYNTDFAQVEVDEQQVNLTRFNLLFPEKREFFLEGRGIFDFAPSSGSTGAGGGNAPRLFFSRRIGLERGAPLPILGGARLTGKLGRFDIGALNVQTDAEAGLALPATNFTVVRLRRDVLRRSSIGTLFANRSSSALGEGSNQTYGVDASFSFYSNVNLLGWFARTETPGVDEAADAFEARLSYDHDTYGLTLDHTLVGGGFNPELGFLRRSDFRQSFASARYSPRPASLESVRKLTFEGRMSYLASDSRRQLEERYGTASVDVEFENSDGFSLEGTQTYENLINPFAIAAGAVIPAGRYDYRDLKLSYSLGLQRRYSGSFSFQYGSFYHGDRTSLGFQRGRIEVLPQLSIEPSLSFNWIELPDARFTSHLAAARLNYSVSPLMFLSGLLQYNASSRTLASNLRLRWEYAPGSEIFVVYTDDRLVDAFDRFPELSNRGLVIKVNRLFRP